MAALVTTGPSVLQRVVNWVAFGWASGGALTENFGRQTMTPGTTAIANTPNTNADAALQLATVWACVDRRAAIMASLPFFTYNVPIFDGQKTLARGNQLYALLHDAPNPRMTPFQFWRAMMLNHDLLGNGYARIVRDGSADGNAVALWPMPASQVQQFVDSAGEVWYQYALGGSIYLFPADDVLHIQNLGNGTHGFDKLQFMRGVIAEGQAQGAVAQQMFASGGKPAAILMTDKVLRPDQRVSLQNRFNEIANGSNSRLHILEAGLKYEPITATPEQLQLSEARDRSVEQICMYLDVPPVVIYHSNVTAWGTGIESIIEGWVKFTLGPLAVNIQQSVRQRVFTSKQRASMDAEISLDALLRGSPEKRFALYSSATQNGIMTRDEARQLENLPAMGGNATKLTVQSALVPLDMLGKIQAIGGLGNTAGQSTP